MLRYSFMFSQNDPGLQRYIIQWLARGPLVGSRLSESDFNTGIVAAYAHRSTDHADVWKRESVYRELELEMRAEFIKEFQKSDAEPDSIKEITSRILSRDLTYVTQEGGRPFPGEESTRDHYACFVIDFGILQKGTGNWKWEAMPNAYKQMWNQVIKALVSDTFRDDVLRLIQLYLEKHPSLSTEDKTKITEFKDRVATLHGKHSTPESVTEPRMELE